MQSAWTTNPSCLRDINNMYTLQQMRNAALKCLSAPESADDANTARSLLDSIEAGSTAENLELADQWFNKPAPLLRG